MGRRQNDSDFGRFALLILFLMGAISCSMVYLFLTVVFRPGSEFMSSTQDLDEKGVEDLGSQEEGQCCRGIEHLELWGDAVKWGAEFSVNSSEDCCMACKRMCGGDGGPCLCNSWVFCGDREACGPRFGECWLKRQKDALNPDRRDAGDQVMWTSGLVFDKGEGIVGLKTDYGILHIKIFYWVDDHFDKTIYLYDLYDEFGFERVYKGSCFVAYKLGMQDYQVTWKVASHWVDTKAICQPEFGTISLLEMQVSVDNK